MRSNASRITSIGSMLGEARAVVAVVELLERRLEARPRAPWGSERPSSESRRGSASTFSVAASTNSRVSRVMSSSRERAGETEVDEPEAAVVEEEDVGRMRVAVEEAVPEDHRHPGVRHPVGELAALLSASARRDVEIAKLHALEALEREHASPSCSARSTFGTATRSSSPKLRRNVLGVAGLVLVVELLRGSSARTRRRALRRR